MSIDQKRLRAFLQERIDDKVATMQHWERIGAQMDARQGRARISRQADTGA